MGLILLGYLVSIAYVFFLIFAIGPLVKSKTNGETSRKVIHTMLMVVWILIDVFFKNSIHQIILPVIFIILNALSYKFKIYKSVERDEGNHLGTVYFAIAITIIMTVAYFFPQLYHATGIATVGLTIGDGFAALVGYNTKSKKILRSKSINGTIACMFATALASFVFCAYYGLELSIVSILVLSVLTGILELTEKGLDNFTVALGVFAFAGALMNMYSAELVIGVVFAILIFLVVFFSKAIDYTGSLLSMVVVFSFSYFGGTVGITYLLGTYFTIFSIAIIKKVIGKRKEGSHSRNFWQIFINGGAGTLFVILYGLSKNPAYMIISIIAIGGCFVDSVSSDIGVLSPKAPRDIIKLKTIDKGLSGGVTALGTLSAIFASAAIAVFAGIALNESIATAVIIGVLCFLHTILDSILGSVIQAKFRCVVCNRMTEERSCCSLPTELVSGIRCINNNVINAVTSLIMVALSMAIFIS